MDNLEKMIMFELSLAMQYEQIERPRDYSALHASSIGDCRRKQGYYLRGATPLLQSSHFLSICDIGNGLHKQLLKRLTSMDWVPADYVELSLYDEEYNISGTLDALSNKIDWVDDDTFFDGRVLPDYYGTRYVIDVKTITSRPRVIYNESTGLVIDVIESQVERLEAIKKEHLYQTTIYSWMVNKHLYPDEPPPDIMVIYVAKDIDHTYCKGDDPNQLLALPYKVFTHHYDKGILEDALKRAKHITDKVAKGQLPTKDFYHKPDKPEWHCECCPFRKQCYSEEGYFANDVEQITPEAKLIALDYFR